MPALKAILLAWAIVLFTDWYFFGVLFHDKYGTFPGVWKKYKDKSDEIRSITLGEILSFISCAIFVLVCDGLHIRGFSQCFLFGLAVWAMGPFSFLVSQAILVNFDRAIVFSHSVGLLVRFMASALGAAIFLS